jgi:signal transduction histidine kinase
MKVSLLELPKSILNETLLKLKALLQAESASFFLFDKDHQELVLNSVLNEQKLQFQGVRQRLSDGVAGSVATHRQGVLVKDIKSDPRFSAQKFRHYHTNSFICVPIETPADGLIGVINISDKESGAPFTEEDFHLASLIAQLTSRMVSGEIVLARLTEENISLKKEKAVIKEERKFLEKFASMGKLAGGIVHEINNPLDAVLRYTNLLIEKDPDKSVAKEYLNEIKIGLTRMMNITRSLLEFSQQLKESSRHETVDIHAVIEEALSLFRHATTSGQISVESRLEENLPKIIDKGLCRVVSNIVKNAFDAMPEGGELKIAAYRENGQVVIAIRDTGHGIPDDVKDKIFTPFFTTKPIGRGIGLGLPICFEVVQRYEGTIECDSQPGLGTEFRIRLPLAKALSAT